MRRLLAPASLLAALLSIALLSTACSDPDTEGRFDEFLENRDRIADRESSTATSETSVPSTDGTPSDVTSATPATTESTPSIPTEVEQCAIVDHSSREFRRGAMDGFSAGEEISGEYLLGLRTALDPTPILFLVTITADDDALDLSFQPLLTDLFTDEESNTGDPRPNAREETGAPLEATATLAADGSFTYTFSDAIIPGNANPASGREIESPTIEIEVGACGSSGFCGYVVRGTATRPLSIPLRGYTVAAIPVDGRDLTSISLVANCEELGEALGL